MSINNIRKYESRFDYEFGSNPLITTNPPQVGDSWVNNVTGEIFVCIDATTDDNIWKGTFGSLITGWTVYGDTFSYVMGSQISNGDTVDKITLSSLAGSTLPSTLSNTTSESNGGKSSSHAYKLGGTYSGNQVQVEKISFSDDSFSGLLTNLSVAVGVGDSWITRDHVYSMGNYTGGGYQSYINKFVYTSETNSNITGTLNSGDGNYGASVQNETTGWYWDSSVSGLQKMTFANEASVSTVSNITATQRNGSCSDVDGGQGYYHSGFNWGRTVTKFSFASEATQANPFTMADDGNNWEDAIGSESQTTGFIFGGDNGAGTEYNRIRTFNFASSGESEGTSGTLPNTRSNTCQVTN
jgi:hypothetical protein